MPQARGSQLGLVIGEESTFGVMPGSPTGFLVYPLSFGLKPNQNLLQDDTLSPDRTRSEPIQGNIDDAGGIPFNMAAEDSGHLLKHLMGTVTTYRPVSKQPTNVTGVVVNRAAVATPLGDGTLAFTFTGTTLVWTAQGDTAGAAVDVSAGGDFTLESGTASRSLYITVTAGSLPGANQSDTDITVAAAYEHVFQIGDLPTSLWIDADMGSNISGSGRYQLHNGVRISKASFNLPQEGFPVMTLDFKGASHSPQSAPQDATPDDNGHTSFSSFMATLEEGGAAFASATSINLEVDNDLDEGAYVIGQQARQALVEQFSGVKGKLEALFDSAVIMNKAANSTETSLKIEFTRGTGDGTADNEYIRFDVDPMKYALTGPDVSGPGGVLQNPDFEAYRSADGTKKGLEIILRNQIASY